MGNSLLTNSSFLGESIAEYELLLEYPDHNLKILEHVTTKQELVLREVSLNDAYMMRNIKQILANREYKLKHPHLF
jgi:hypothetical protein